MPNYGASTRTARMFDWTFVSCQCSRLSYQSIFSLFLVSFSCKILICLNKHFAVKHSKSISMQIGSIDSESNEKFNEIRADLHYKFWNSKREISCRCCCFVLHCFPIFFSSFARNVIECACVCEIECAWKKVKRVNSPQKRNKRKKSVETNTHRWETAIASAHNSKRVRYKNKIHTI